MISSVGGGHAVFVHADVCVSVKRFDWFSSCLSSSCTLAHTLKL